MHKEMWCFFYIILMGNFLFLLNSDYFYSQDSKTYGQLSVISSRYKIVSREYFSFFTRLKIKQEKGLMLYALQMMIAYS